MLEIRLIHFVCIAESLTTNAVENGKDTYHKHIVEGLARLVPRPDQFLGGRVKSSQGTYVHTLLLGQIPNNHEHCKLYRLQNGAEQRVDTSKQLTS